MSKKTKIDLKGNSSGFGSKKHGVSGHSGKSPKLRFHMKLDAERNEIKAKSTNCRYESVTDLFKNK